MSRPWFLAIDIGTSNTAAAHTNSATGVIEPLALTHTSNLMPSAVLVDGDTILAGSAAVHHALAAPQAFVPSPKLLLTRAAESATIDGRQIPVTALLAATISMVLAAARAQHAGSDPAAVVLTHPEAWSPQHTEVLVDAAAAAGVDRSSISLMAEPHAAARHYAQSHDLPAGARLGIFDFGGGTLDVAVLAVDDVDEFTVVGAAGDPDLGGRNFDEQLQEWVRTEVDEEFGDDVWESVDPPQRIRLVLDIQTAKETLSDAASASVTVTTGDGNVAVQVTRPDFEDRAAPLVQRAVDLAEATFTASGPVSTVYLTGGSSRIPLVHARLAAVAPVATLDDPKMVVAQGALTSLVLPEPVMLVDSTPTPRFRDAPTPSAPRRRLVAAAAIVLVSAVVVGGWVWRSHRSADPSAPHDLSAAPIATTEDQVRAGLPVQLAGALGGCRRDEYTEDQALLFQCDLGNSPVVVGTLVADNALVQSAITIGIDLPKARREVAGARAGITVTDHSGILVENTARTATAVINPSVIGWSIEYADLATGVIASMSGFETPAAARTFLQRSGLVT